MSHTKTLQCNQKAEPKHKSIYGFNAPQDEGSYILIRSASGSNSLNQSRTQTKNPQPESRTEEKSALYQLELTENMVYVTEEDSGECKFFELEENIKKKKFSPREPKNIAVSGQIFGSMIENMMRPKENPPTATAQCKKLCQFVMAELGLILTADGSVSEKSEIPEYAIDVQFGAKNLPVELIKNQLKKWSNEEATLIKLEISCAEKIPDKEKMAENLFCGMTFEKIWAASIHEDSLFCDADLDEYEDRLKKEYKYNLALDDDPVLMYATVSNNREKMAVMAISDYAVKFTFCHITNDGAYLELRDMFMEITELEEGICELELERLLKRLCG